jgi:hypothetical protein
VIVGKVMEEPKDEVFCRGNVAVFDETIEVGEDYA